MNAGTAMHMSTRTLSRLTMHMGQAERDAFERRLERTLAGMKLATSNTPCADILVGVRLVAYTWDWVRSSEQTDYVPEPRHC